MDSLVTIVTPVYNSAPYLETFFACLRRQTFKSFRLLIVYDRSSDNTLDLLRQNVKQTLIFPCQILEKPQLEGVGKARDFAIDSGLIQSPYVVFLDCDDSFSPLYLEKMVVRAQESNADITMCGYKRIDGLDEHVISTEMVSNPPAIENLAQSEILPFLNPAPWNKLIKTSLIGDARFIHKGGGEDLMFFLKLLPKANKIVFVNEPLYIYKVNPGSKAAGTDCKMIEEAEKGYLETQDFYRNHGSVYQPFQKVFSAFVFLRLGIRLTTRVCLAQGHGYRKTIKATTVFLNTHFPDWKTNRYLSFAVSIKHGFKSLMVWGCRWLYKIHLFSFFVSVYRLYTRLTKKDIKW
jgi:glycosyltransferase involved in cell wall biosynthesis